MIYAFLNAICIVILDGKIGKKKLNGNRQVMEKEKNRKNPCPYVVILFLSFALFSSSFSISSGTSMNEEMNVFYGRETCGNWV
jgi:hypothetical protein